MRPETSFGLTRSVVFLPMIDVPEDWKPRLRDLSYGREEGTMVRWTYHDGSTFVAVLFEGLTMTPRNIVGWSVITYQEEPNPVLGTYVDQERRGRGYGTEIVKALLTVHRDRIGERPVLAVARLWPKYPEVISAAGFEWQNWDNP